MSSPPVNIKIENLWVSCGPMYWYPEQAKDIILSMLNNMDDWDITECSTSAWLSLIVLVNKPDGSKQICLDCQHVNKHLTTVIYPLPCLNELVEQAAGHKYYVTLDTKDACFQILLDPENCNLTMFSDGVTLYRFRHLTFRLNLSSAIFSRHMAAILAPLLKEGWLRNYVTDLILSGPDFDVLLERVKRLFTLLTESGVKLNLSKCTFGLKEVNFLGYIISEEGSRPNPKNLEVVMKMKLLTMVKKLQWFLGMVGFYCKHMP